MKECSNCPNPVSPRKRGAFTLIELLVVISIIGVLASLVVGLSGVAIRKSRLSRITGELNQYVTAIESYKADKGFYPPDHKYPKIPPPHPTNTVNTVIHPLYYELAGTVLIGQSPNQRFQVKNSDEILTVDTVQNVFQAPGFANASTETNAVKGYFSFKASQYGKSKEYPEVNLMKVPLDWPTESNSHAKFEKPPIAGEKFNPWRYDASSVNRRNRSGFDLWAEVYIGGEKKVIGNW